METETIFSTIYPEARPLDGLPDPQTGAVYRMLSASQLIKMANWTLEVLLRMGIDQVLVSESGAVPFARICAWIAWKKNLGLQWHSIKIPRNIKETARATLEAYLSLPIEELSLTYEFNKEPSGFSFTGNSVVMSLPNDYFDSRTLTLKEILETIQDKTHFSGHNHFLRLTQSTGLAKILERPFIFFDEYIDSGKTLFQSFRFFNLFGKTLQFKIFSYLIKLSKADLNQTVCESLYTLDNEHQAYQQGIYPFENRIDWLGYYYMSHSCVFRKICISELRLSKYILTSNLQAVQSNHSLNELLDLIDLLRQDSILNDIKRHCKVLAVSKWIRHQHLIQYSLYKLEEIYFGKNESSEFLYQLFDLYGPIWSPLPDDYHISYLEAFEKTSEKMRRFFSTKLIGILYQRVRTRLIRNIAQLCEARRIHQQQILLMALENSNEP